MISSKEVFRAELQELLKLAPPEDLPDPKNAGSVEMKRNGEENTEELENSFNEEQEDKVGKRMKTHTEVEDRTLKNVMEDSNDISAVQHPSASDLGHIMQTPGPSGESVPAPSVDDSVNEQNHRSVVNSSSPLLGSKETENSGLHFTHEDTRDSQNTSKKGSGKGKCRVRERKINWKEAEFGVRKLVGHSDSICKVDLDGDIVLSASCDTTVKVWDASTGSELYSLRGHTGPVTCVCLLDTTASEQLGVEVGAPQERLALTGSLDCTIKLWTVLKGEMVLSIYTYNGITCLGYIPQEMCAVTGTDGGKVELFHLVTKTVLQSVKAYNDSVMDLKVQRLRIYTASKEGALSVWELREKLLRPIFVSENVRNMENKLVLLKQINSIEVHEDKIYFGDNGPNMKVLSWRQGRVSKLPNHPSEFGMTDCICSVGNALLTSSYDLDTALGSINVRELPSEMYHCSLTDEDTGRIISLAAIQHGELVRFVTGGTELKVWEWLPPKKKRRSVKYKDLVIVQASFLPRYTQPAEDSEEEVEESEQSESEEEDDDEEGGDTEAEHTEDARSADTARGWWCHIL